MEVTFSPNFLRSLRNLPEKLQEEAIEKIIALQDIRNHRQLKVHKLTGRLKDCYSFSVNYKMRILFEYVGKPRRAYLMELGDHDVYE